MNEELELTIEHKGSSVKTTIGDMRRLADGLKKGRIMPQQIEMPAVGERTGLGQRAYDVLQQKGLIADEQEKLAELVQSLMNQMRLEGKLSFKASGYVFTIADMGEKIKITKD